MYLLDAAGLSIPGNLVFPVDENTLVGSYKFTEIDVKDQWVVLIGTRFLASFFTLLETKPSPERGPSIVQPHRLCLVTRLKATIFLTVQGDQ